MALTDGSASGKLVVARKWTSDPL